MNLQAASKLERLLWHDPARRGPAAAAARGELPVAGHLQAAASSLRQARAVLLFTGFPVRRPGAPLPETDGPPGTLLLAWSLHQLGARTMIVTDPWARELLQLGLRMLSLPEELLRVAPSGEQDAASQVTCSLLPREQITHLVAIERPGPSHHRESLARWGFSPREQHRWIQQMGLGAQDRCFNMRGEFIHRWCSGPGRLFEHLACSLPQVTTIGVLDGGNELGAGSLDPRRLAQALGTPVARRILCRVPCRHVILCGTSNWGGYALALLLAQQAAALCRWPGREFVEQFVLQSTAAGLCLDGVTGQGAPSVDGQPLEQELSLLQQLRRVVEG